MEKASNASPSASRGRVETAAAPTSAANRSRKMIGTPRQLRRLIEGLSPESSLTDAFSKKWRAAGRQGGGPQERAVVWYDTQHQHWLGWLGGWSGPGAYGRQNWKRSAAFVYAHIVNPQMLVYLAEAAGLPKALVVKAMDAALANRRSMQSMSAAIRRVVPWTLVERSLIASSPTAKNNK